MNSILGIQGYVLCEQGTTMIHKTLISIAFAAIAASAFTQQTGFYSDGRPERLFYPVSGLENRDINFLRNAQIGNEFEIESSQIALTNSNDEVIKQFAKEMIDDHGGAKNEITQVAMLRSTTVSGELPKNFQNMLNKLRNLHGADFDMAYRAAQKMGHEGAINLFKGEIAHGHDQEVKSVAVKELPTIQLHYKMLIAGKTMTGSSAATHGE